MGVIANIANRITVMAILRLIPILAAIILVGGWYFYPLKMMTALSWIDAELASIANYFNPDGSLAALLQLAGAGFVVMVSVTIIATGITLRKFVSKTMFRWRRILTIGLIPLLAHVVKWGLGYWWPALLAPAQYLVNMFYARYDLGTQAQLDLVNVRGHLMTIIIGLVLMMLWSLATFIWRWFRGRKTAAPTPSPQPQPPAPRGRKGHVMKKLLHWGWRLLTLPFRLLWRVIKWPFTHDIILGPITWFIFQVGLAVGAGYVVTEGVEWGLDYLSATSLQNFPHVWVWIFFSILFLLPRWKEEMNGEGENAQMSWKLDIYKIDKAGRGAQVTWLGMVTPFIVTTGIYPLFGERFGFGRLFINSETIAEDGLYIIGPITFQVWQTPHAAKDSKERSTITLQAGNGATVRGNFSFIFEGRRRKKWEEAGNAGLQVGNRGRQELQEIIERFIDRDVKSIQPVMSRLILGEAMVTCFLPKEVDGREAGSIIRDVNKKPIYVFIGDWYGNKKTGYIVSDQELATQVLEAELSKRGDKKFVAALARDAEGMLITTVVQADHGIKEMIDALGQDLKEVIYDSVLNSEVVEQAANRASSEEKQREAQLASARTNKAVRQELLPSNEELNNPDHDKTLELRTILAAAQDNPDAARVILLAGGVNDLTRAVAGANLVNNGDKK